MPFTSRLLTMPRSAILLIVANLAVFAFVLAMQYGGQLAPCILCLWQRIPYVVALTAALLALMVRRQAALWLGVCVPAYLAGFGLAIFHTGVERHWWLGTASCSTQPLTGASPDDLREALLHTVAPRCDEIAWTFLHLSMANWNILASLALAIFATVAAVRAAQDEG